MGQPVSLPDRPTIPVAYLELLVEILAERGIESSRLLAGIAIRPGLLERTDARMSAVQWTRLVQRALELTRDPALGYAYGLRMRPTAHGLVGYAAMSASTIRHAIEISSRYIGVRQAHFGLELDVGASGCRLILRPRFPILVLRAFFLENILLGLARAFSVFLGRELREIPELEVCFDFSEPPYFQGYREHLPRIRFGDDECSVRFPRAFLELRPVLADPQASRQAVALCERELALAADDDADFAARVRAELHRSDDGGYPQLDEVAARLSVSTRTLKRKLQRSGTSFLLLLRDARERDAHVLLTQTELTIHAIAARLGYVNPANFSRAFVDWKGVPPTEYRRRFAAAT